MPIPFSMYHGGIVPCLLRMLVRRLIAAANGRASSYVNSDIGASELGWWQFWQLRCRIGATSRVNVTFGAVGACPCSCTGVRNTAAPRRPDRASNAIRDAAPEKAWGAVIRLTSVRPLAPHIPFCTALLSAGYGDSARRNRCLPPASGHEAGAEPCGH